MQVLRLLVLAIWVSATASTSGQSMAQWREMRDHMVDEEIVAAGVENKRVIDSVRRTDRHEFVPLAQRRYAYFDMALPIGEQQTISPPFVVAYMTEQLDPQPTDKVLEIGTGSGYQAAVLSPLVKDVYTIEIVEDLGRRAARTLERLDYKNVHTRIGDGFLGWPEVAPFDKIIVTCSPEQVPQPLVDQLRDGGLMVVPVGERYQQTLYLFRKMDGELEREALRPTLFVPMTGAAEEQRERQPDPLNPSLANGGFEETLGKPGDEESEALAGWHYLRQGKLIKSSDAPEGGQYLRFSNDTPGRGAQALQGFPIDGRKVESIDVSFRIRGSNVRYGQSQREWPYVVVTYYDDRRAPLHSESIGPFQGTFDWSHRTARLPTPVKAREAIFRIGLLGAIGELSFDDMQLAPTPSK